MFISVQYYRIITHVKFRFNYTVYQSHHTICYSKRACGKITVLRSINIRLYCLVLGIQIRTHIIYDQFMSLTMIYARVHVTICHDGGDVLLYRGVPLSAE